MPNNCDLNILIWIPFYNLTYEFNLLTVLSRPGNLSNTLSSNNRSPKSGKILTLEGLTYYSYNNYSDLPSYLWQQVDSLWPRVLSFPECFADRSPILKISMRVHGEHFLLHSVVSRVLFVVAELVWDNCLLLYRFRGENRRRQQISSQMNAGVLALCFLQLTN